MLYPNIVLIIALMAFILKEAQTLSVSANANPILLFYIIMHSISLALAHALKICTQI